MVFKCKITNRTKIYFPFLPLSLRAPFPPKSIRNAGITSLSLWMLMLNLSSAPVFNPLRNIEKFSSFVSL